MAEQEFCQRCKQRGDCREIYGKLGEVEGPSVTFKVVVAFLLPMVVFIGSLAVFEAVFAGVTSVKGLGTAAGLLAAGLATCTCVYVTRVISRQFGEDR